MHKQAKWMVMLYLLLGNACAPAPVASSIKDSPIPNSGGRTDPATVAIINGFDTKGGAWGICSGTFLRGDLILTAGHCGKLPNSKMIVVDSFDDRHGAAIDVNDVGSLQGLSFMNTHIHLAAKSSFAAVFAAAQAAGLPTSTNIMVHPNYLALQNDWQDVAVVQLPQALPSAVASIAHAKPAVGSTVHFVGYGLLNENDFNSIAIRHGGQNVLVENSAPLTYNGKIYGALPKEATMLRLDGPAISQATTTASQAISHQGDSGTGLYNDQEELVGTCSLGAAGFVQGAPYTSLFTDIQDETISKFLIDRLAYKPYISTDLYYYTNGN